MRCASKELARAIEHLEKGEWQAAHEIVQTDESSPLCCWAHGIVHLLEGDAANARYWYRLAGRSFPEAGCAADEIRDLKSSTGIGRAK